MNTASKFRSSPAPVVAPVAQTREQAEAANAKEWAQSLPTAQLERLLGDARDHLQSLGAASFEAAKAEWNARKDASQTPAEPAPSVESVQPAAPSAMGWSGAYAAKPSPAEPVKVLGGEAAKVHPAIDFLDALIEERPALAEHTERLREARNDLAEVIDSHLAKIQALEAAIEKLLTDSNISAYISGLEAKPLDEVDEYEARTIQSAEDARAALALPTAPRSDS